jgi:uncharacterized protein
MPNIIDVVFLTLITVVATVLETLVFFPGFKAEVAAGVPGARTRAYRRAAIAQWVFAIICLGLWVRAGRAWSTLGFVPPGGVRMLVGIALGAGILYLTVRQVRGIRRLTPEKLEALRPKFGYVEFFLPHTREEYRGFMFLSFTAGFCEELLYRGYLFWVIGAYIGLPAAIAAGTVLFGIAHAYQGGRGMIKTALTGLALSLIFVGSGWLIPGMVIHALVDAIAGVLAFKVYQRDDQQPLARDGDEPSAVPLAVADGR